MGQEFMTSEELAEMYGITVDQLLNLFAEIARRNGQTLEEFIDEALEEGWIELLA